MRTAAVALLLVASSGCASWKAERRSWTTEASTPLPTRVVLNDAKPVQRLRLEIEVSEAARQTNQHRRAVRADVEITGRWELRGATLPQRALLTSDLRHRDIPFRNASAFLYEMDPTSERPDLDSSVMLDVAGAYDECKRAAGPCTFVVIATFSWYGERRGEVIIEPEVRVRLHADGRSYRATAPPSGAIATIVDAEVLPPLRGGAR